MERERDVIRIRRAGAADADAIYEVHARAIREVCADWYAPAEIEAWVGRLYPGIHSDAIATYDLFVAVEADRILGFGQMDGESGEIHGCYVHPDALRRGVGRKLVAALEVRARALGLPRLTLDASLNAVAFYRTLGFAEESPRRHALEGGVEIACVPMTKPLA